MITTQLKTVTPDWAVEMLNQCNNGNRRLRRWWAEAMASAMRRGEWITTHQGIAFTTDGRLLDGQHRLLAVSLAKTPVDMLVFTGVPSEAFSVLDIGVKRNIADTTGLSARTAEVCRLAVTKTFGGTPTSQQVSNLASAGLSEVHERLLSYCSTKAKLYTCGAARLAACVLVMDGHPEDYVFDLYRKLALQDLQCLPPVGFAFVRQANTNRMTTSGSVGSDDVLARALKVFNPETKNLTKVQVSTGETASAVEFTRRVLRRSLGTQSAAGGFGSTGT